MIRIKILSILIISQLILCISCESSEESDNTQKDTKPGQPEEKEKQKETYFPSDIWNVDQNNDYQDSSSQFSVYRMKETPNLVAFWEPGFGNDPLSTADSRFRFPLDDLMQESEKIYRFYCDSLKFVEKGNYLTDKYRIVFYIYYTEEGTCYGGGADSTIGVMWLSPGRVKSKPYGTIAHEMGHAFQYMVSADGAWGFRSNPQGSKGQAIFEMTSQYMLWQIYPNWMQFENYHFQAFMLNTHKAFLHEDNCYCSPHVLEYWSDKHGIDFVGKIWREAKEGEDPVMTYKRITNINQQTFNDEMIDADLKFITWDMDRIRKYSQEYANLHTCAFKSVEDGWYQITENRCPQNYGYNGIRLEVPKRNKEIILNFKGLAGAPGYNAIKTDKAGWRYAFVAVKGNGERIYGNIYSDIEGQAKFTVPDNTAYLWLVVTGAPTEHWEHIWDDYAGNDEQWPYQIKLTGTTLHSTVQK